MCATHYMKFGVGTVLGPRAWACSACRNWHQLAPLNFSYDLEDYTGGKTGDYAKGSRHFNKRERER